MFSGQQVRLRRLEPSVLSRFGIVLLLGTGATLGQSVLRIVVVEGDGAINNVRTRTTHAPVVEVRNEQNDVVQGASVTFQAPSDGASADFGEGTRTFVTQ